MIIIADVRTKKILARYDAWELDAMENVGQFVQDNDYEIADSEITFNGDMIVWVA